MSALMLQTTERTASQQETPDAAYETIQRHPDDTLSIVCQLGQRLYFDEWSSVLYCLGSRRYEGLANSTDDSSACVLFGPRGTIRLVGRHIELDDLFTYRVPYRALRVATGVSNQAPSVEPGCELATQTPSANPYLEAIKWIRDNTELPVENIGDLVGVSRRAVYDWMHGKQKITDEHRRRLLAVLHILQRAAELHRTEDQLTAWLYTPRGADGKTPAELLKAGEFDRVRLLAVTTPSPDVKRPPEWVSRPGPTGRPEWQDRMPESVPSSEDDALDEVAGDESRRWRGTSEIKRRR